MIRLSLGDFEFDGVQFLNEDANTRMANGHNDGIWIVYMYWFCWIVSMLMLNIIFLNFIVAELSNTYTEVS